MPSLPMVVALTFAGIALASILACMLYIVIRYSPIVARIFEEKPLFLPLRVAPLEEGEAVRFPTSRGLSLAGTYLKARTPNRTGVLVFCHEYLSNRWSVVPYLDALRDHGFDLLTFDFRNHGESDADPRYTPLQWVTQHELRDLEAAIAYLRSRPDADPAGFGLFGVSRGGGTAICVAAQDRGAWGVITDGAFPTRGTMLAYIHRWAAIYVQSPWVWKILPNLPFEFLGWSGRVRTEIKLGCRYPSVERAVARIAPRPWLAIHGQKDAYIGVAIAERFHRLAGEPKELWVVPGAKHNRCREKEPLAYAGRLLAFFERFAPRRPEAPAPVIFPTGTDGLEADTAVPIEFGLPITPGFILPAAR